jgi:NADH dehydrogenase [ubiquinone] 1 alpha subcomplex assembly factor 1
MITESRSMHSRNIFVILLLLNGTAVAKHLPATRSLFTFKDTDVARQWQTVNDGVMGGRSDGRFRVNGEGNLEFFGTLSPANNGGFAAGRSRGTSLNLQSGDSIVMKVRGDGRKYTLNLYTPVRRMAFSYRVTFPTRNGEWTEISAPLSDFVPTSFGRVFSKSPLRPNQISGIGVLLGDKKPRAFRPEIESISVQSTGS